MLTVFSVSKTIRIAKVKIAEVKIINSLSNEESMFLGSCFFLSLFNFYKLDYNNNCVAMLPKLLQQSPI